jgi:hypothetical protein
LATTRRFRQVRPICILQPRCAKLASTVSPPRETWIAKLIAAERAEAEARDTVVSQNQTGTKMSDAGRLAAGEASLYRHDLGA